ncbi:MAG: hypothetical protein FNP40_15330 [Dehalobacter sp. 4CP]|uniref:SHOCT-like domain-containing protein n=1 Tax=unclassified Dehalobacter TaxID=2635733 RepID=UPI000475028B|nr:hypothetical protein [Dehalobacter sp.]NBJ16896.1 hypothetical protein [Dehalobacter sp. 4CP]
MSSERLKVLEMIQEGKITAAEGMELLKAIEESAPEVSPAVSVFANRFLRVRVEGEKAPKVNVNIPMNLVKSVTKLANAAMAFIPPEAKSEIDKRGIDLEYLLNELIQELEQGSSGGKLVDVDVDDPHEGRMKVEVFVD